MPASAFGVGRWLNAAGVSLALAIFLFERFRNPSATLEKP
jgi:hypothetical protein